jgi:hypothetical protein
MGVFEKKGIQSFFFSIINWNWKWKCFVILFFSLKVNFAISPAFADESERKKNYVADMEERKVHRNSREREKANRDACKLIKILLRATRLGKKVLKGFLVFLFVYILGIIKIFYLFTFNFFFVYIFFTKKIISSKPRKAILSKHEPNTKKISSANIVLIIMDACRQRTRLDATRTRARQLF